MRRWLPLLALFAACAKDEGSADSAGVCGDVAELDTWAPGVAHHGDGDVLSFALTAADPAPPDKGDNVWTIRITTVADAAPVDGVSVTVAPLMPEHGHGTNPASFGASPSGEPGTYVTEPFDLFMGGVWEITVAASGSTSDSAVFRFCVEG